MVLRRQDSQSPRFGQAVGTTDRKATTTQNASGQAGIQDDHRWFSQGHYVNDGRGKKILVFKEKGVDVHLAVDAVDLAGDQAITTAVICSSDSDLQPAITKLKRRGVEVIYVGFESLQNRGLTYTCDRTILFRDAEVSAGPKAGRRRAFRRSRRTSGGSGKCGLG